MINSSRENTRLFDGTDSSCPSKINFLFPLIATSTFRSRVATRDYSLLGSLYRARPLSTANGPLSTPGSNSERPIYSNNQQHLNEGRTWCLFFGAQRMNVVLSMLSLSFAIGKIKAVAFQASQQEGKKGRLMGRWASGCVPVRRRRSCQRLRPGLQCRWEEGRCRYWIGCPTEYRVLCDAKRMKIVGEWALPILTANVRPRRYEMNQFKTGPKRPQCLLRRSNRISYLRIYLFQ